MGKNRPHKYIKRIPNGKGGWRYIYEDQKVKNLGINYLENLVKITHGKQQDYFRAQLNVAKPVKVESLHSVLSPDEISVVKRLGIKAKGCYHNAWKVATTIPGVKYVEGYTFLYGVPIEHAWNEKDGKYFDVTEELALQNRLNSDYTVILELDKFEIYKYAEKTGHSGPYIQIWFKENFDNMMKSVLKDSLKKAYLDGDISLESFNKAIRNLSHLVPKKVQVKRKDGTTYQAIRWVDPETGKSPKIHGKSKVEDSGDITEENISSKVNEIIESGKSGSEKLRDLMNIGIYDKSVLSLLTGVDYGRVHSRFKEAGIDVKKDLPKGAIEGIKEEIRKVQKNITPETRESSPILREFSVDELWETYERNLKRVMTGRHKFCLAYGTGGVGKTYTFEKLAEELELREYDEEIQPNNDQYDYVVIKGRISPSQVYAEMYRHRDKLIVFDDCDTFLSTTEVQGFLKAGLDTGKTTKISNKSPKKIYNIEGDPDSGVIPSTFSFKGRVIAITNLSSQQIDQAVRSRALASNLTMTVDETIDKLESILDKINIYTADKSSIIEVRPEARKLAFNVLKEFKDKLGKDINTRVLSNAILIADEGMADGVDERAIRREIRQYFDSVTGEFDKIMRQIK